MELSKHKYETRTSYYDPKFLWHAQKRGRMNWMYFTVEKLEFLQLCFRRPRDRAFCQLPSWSESILGVVERRIEHQALTLSPILYFNFHCISTLHCPCICSPLALYICDIIWRVPSHSLCEDRDVDTILPPNQSWRWRLINRQRFWSRLMRRQFLFFILSLQWGDKFLNVFCPSNEETIFNVFIFVPPMRRQFLKCFLSLQWGNNF